MNLFTSSSSSTTTPAINSPPLGVTTIAQLSGAFTALIAAAIAVYQGFAEVDTVNEDQVATAQGRCNPKPGIDGATTWKASAATPPWETGSVRGPIMVRNSTTELGYPWLMIRGSTPGSGERTCRKWMSWPSMVVVYCGYSLSFASHWRQSYPFCQYSASSLRCPSGTPRLHPTPGSSSGQRVRAKRSCRSSTSAFGILTWKGRTLISD